MTEQEKKNASLKVWRAKNREKYNAYQNAWRAKHRDQVNASRKEAYQRDPWRFKRQVLKKLYGMTGEQFKELAEAQGGLCAVCRKPPSGKRGLCVDHCHATGSIRGLLCIACNRGVGYLKDNPDLLETAAAYLRKPKRIAA